jgi:DNA-binding beta-propeller fold protein YncE
MISAGCGAAPAPESASPPPSASNATGGASTIASPTTSSLPAQDAGAQASAAARAPVELTAKPIALPNATAPASMDYLAYERGSSRVWIPLADSSGGTVAVLDVGTGLVTSVNGFKTAEREVRGKKRYFGPSAASLGNGFAYIGNRATNEVCAVDAKTLKLGQCARLPPGTDGVAYVPNVNEVWVTNQKEHALIVLDSSKPEVLKLKTTIKVDGDPEGYGVDESRGLFFTNLEDKGDTLGIDVKTHKVVSTWKAGCNADGPRGLAVDSARGFVIIACTEHLQVLDGNHQGAPLGTLDTGAGVDNIDFLDAKKLVYAAAGKAARLTVARLDDRGQLTAVATGATPPGTRNPVVDAKGTAYLTDAANARVVSFPPADAPGR